MMKCELLRWLELQHQQHLQESPRTSTYMTRPTRRAQADDARCNCDDGAAQDCLGLPKPGPGPRILSHHHQLWLTHDTLAGGGFVLALFLAGADVRGGGGERRSPREASTCFNGDRRWLSTASLTNCEIFRPSGTACPRIAYLPFSLSTSSAGIARLMGAWSPMV